MRRAMRSRSWAAGRVQRTCIRISGLARRSPKPRPKRRNRRYPQQRAQASPPRQSGLHHRGNGQPPRGRDRRSCVRSGRRAPQGGLPDLVSAESPWRYRLAWLSLAARAQPWLDPLHRGHQRTATSPARYRPFLWKEPQCRSGASVNLDQHIVTIDAFFSNVGPKNSGNNSAKNSEISAVEQQDNSDGISDKIATISALTAT